MAYEAKNQRFVVRQRDYNRQYAQMYFSRLSLMAGRVGEQVAAKWPGVPLVKVLEVQKSQSQQVAVMGTLFKVRLIRSGVPPRPCPLV